MEFSGLETLLIAFGVASVTVVATIYGMSRCFISCRECDQRHGGLVEDIQIAGQETRRAREDLRLCFEILREVVVRLPGVSEAEKARILNTRPGKQQ